AALEKRCAQAPWVRIPPSPPVHVTRAADPVVVGSPHSARHASVPLSVTSQLPHSMRSAERSPRGLGRRTGNAVWGNPSRVRIPPSPPPLLSPGGPWPWRWLEIVPVGHCA